MDSFPDIKERLNFTEVAFGGAAWMDIENINSKQDISKVILSQEFWIEIKNDL